MHSSTTSSSAPSYSDIIEKYNISDTSTSTIPSSRDLVGLRNDLRTLEDIAKARSRACDKSLRDLHLKTEARRNEGLGEERKRGCEEGDRERKLKKKRRAESSGSGESKRPPAVGAHQTTNQTLESTAQSRYPVQRALPIADEVTGEKKKLKSSSPEVKRRDSSSPEASRSDVEHQPPPAPPYVVFTPLDDDPAVYEIPAVDETTSYEDKARAFSVTRFPEDDLSSLIPGDPPDEDLSKAKPTNQVAINTFSTYIEPYFRPFSEEDVAFLRERGDRLTPFLIPKLGRHYSEVWAEEDGGGPTAGYTVSPAPASNPHSNPAANTPRGKPDDLSEDALEREDISCGPLLSRLLSTYLPDDSPPASPPDPNAMDLDDQKPHSTPSTSLPQPANTWHSLPTLKSDYSTLDERLRREMIFVGLLSPLPTSTTTSSPPPGGANSLPQTDIDFLSPSDDAISSRLRHLQHQLRETSLLNGARKSRINNLLKENLAWQEYQTILEDLDKQVEQSYTKRMRNLKAQGSKKKNKGGNGVGVGVARTGLGEATKGILERRRRWVGTIGPVFENGVGEMRREGVFEGLEGEVERERGMDGGDEE